MKNKLLIMSIMTFVFFGCTTSEIETQIEGTADLSVILSSKEFQNAVSNKLNVNIGNDKFTSTSRGQNKGNGVVVVQSAFQTLYFFFTDQGPIIFSAGNSPDSVKLLPTGLAQFSAKSSSPQCSVLDFNFNTIYSNDCLERRTGHLNVNVITAVDIVEFPFGTGYFPKIEVDENGNPIFYDKTANIFKATNVKVNDQQVIYDENFEPIGCTEASVEHFVSLKSIFIRNREGEPRRIFDYVLK
jgi:hypothetical protein